MAPRGTYRQIADSIREQIGSGELTPGGMVPSELALAEQHNVSRGTVRAALGVLVDEGLIEVMPGQGRRVVGDPVTASLNTAWERVARPLQRALESGQFPLGVALPSESELMNEYGVSRNTVRRAYQQLVKDGLVVVRHGAGAFPAPR